MKHNMMMWLLPAMLLLAACSDSGVDTVEEQKKEIPDVKKTDYVEFQDDYKQVAANGETFNLTFKTDLNEDDIDVMYYNQNGMFESMRWSPKGLGRSASVNKELTISVSVGKNEGAHSRCSDIYVCSHSDESKADTITIVQDGQSLRTSTDFSMDKRVVKLQTHTQGGGIPVILMGDGFGDAEVADNTYETTMRKAMENLFSEQPMTALQGYFDVYMVYAVSKQNDVGLCYDSALSTVMPADGTTSVEGDDDAVQDYADLVAGRDDNLLYDIRRNALVVVVLNNNGYAGTTYFYTMNDEYVDFSVCYCPVINSLDDEYFREVLSHEAAGHGFAKLADEYEYEDNYMLTDDARAEINEVQSIGWMQNVSVSSYETPWADFIKDESYSGEPEQIAVYEGAYGYMAGAYRPSYESLMRDNINHFNAPCRKLIYDKVREKNGQTASTLDEFKQLDSTYELKFLSKEELMASSRGASWQQKKPFARPRVHSLKKRPSM